LSFVFFKIVAKVVLASDHVFSRACLCYPIVVFVGIFINLFFILNNADKNFTVENYLERVVIPCSFGGSFIAALLTHLVFIPWIKNRLGEEDEPVAFIENKVIKNVEDGADESAENSAEDSAEDGAKEVVKEVEPDNKEEQVIETNKKSDIEEPVKSRNFVVRTWDWIADNTYRQDLMAMSLEESKGAADIWSRMEVKDIKTEKLFGYLQVFTACLAAFAHGSNDVSHAIGPLSSILDIYKNGELKSKTQEDIWMLALGGFGIALGFAVYGAKVIQALGYKLAAISPSRGFCMEMAAALAVSVATYLKIPVSTTQCLVGATIGVGIADNGKDCVQWWFLARVLAGWVGIFFTGVIASAGFFAFSAFSPKA
jgi:sodium-dependent phosphate transporter